MENEELIREDMEATREAVNDKVESLETKMANTVAQVRSTVEETMTDVKETWHEGVESAKEAVDVRRHVDHHPWLMLGGSIAAGYVIGSLLAGSEKSSSASSKQPHLLIHSQPPGAVPTTTSVSTGPSLMSTLSGWLGDMGPEMNHMKSMAIGAAISVARDLLVAQVPPPLAGKVRQIIDSAGQKLSGEPLPDMSSLLKSSAQTQTDTGASVGAS